MEQVLNALNIISVTVSSWSGGVTLKKEEVNIDLPEKAFTLGRKHLISPERLSPFTTLRRRAADRCLKDGTSFLGGYALPADENVLAALVADLEAMKAEFNLKKDELLRDFNQAIDEWCDEEEVRPYEHLIRKSLPSIQSIERKLSFDFSIFKVAAPQGVSDAYLEKEVSNISNTLFGEVSDAANQLLDSFMERQSGISKDEWIFSARTVTAMEGIKNKLYGLRVVDSRIIPIVDEVDRVLTLARSVKGKLEGDIMRQLFSTLMILSNEDRMLALGEGLSGVQNVIGEFFPKKEEPQIDTVEQNKESDQMTAMESSVELDEFQLEFYDFENPPMVSLPTLDTSKASIAF